MTVSEWLMWSLMDGWFVTDWAKKTGEPFKGAEKASKKACKKKLLYHHFSVCIIFSPTTNLATVVVVFISFLASLIITISVLCNTKFVSGCYNMPCLTV